jgi:hypothetical protein
MYCVPAHRGVEDTGREESRPCRQECPRHTVQYRAVPRLGYNFKADTASLDLVNGLVGKKPMNLATSRNGLAGDRSNRTNRALQEWDIRFLEYRLEVVGSWPDSARKVATIEAIVLRLDSVRSAG